MSDPISSFIKDIEAQLKGSIATEHTYRPFLKILFETVLPSTSATNEPKHEEYGAPDFVIHSGVTPIGHVEAKNIGVDLIKIIAESEKEKPSTDNARQLKRYRAALSNLLYTDGLEWHWFVNGEPRLENPIRIATWDKRKKQLNATSAASVELSKLLQQFLTQQVPTINKPIALATKLAQVARWLYEVILSVLKQQGDQGELRNQLEAFRKTLLPTLSEEEFADMYAQTIIYGLFAARVAGSNQKAFTRSDAAIAIPKTNPFLRKLFQEIAGFDLDERIAWLVDDCASLLERTAIEDVLQNFGKTTQKQDPIFHFYETFLAAYNPDLRVKRGVYYTPESVVSYIVRSVDYLLSDKFDKPLGLADDKTIILDPATGTGTFLNTVIQQIRQNLVNQGFSGGWGKYVEEKLLPRIFGFELLMAPYTIAHLKLGLLLKDLGYDFGGKEKIRLGVFLTNTLADTPHLAQQMPFAKYITDEGHAANEVKWDKHVMVVIGNPPYAGYSANEGVWIDELMADYKKTVLSEERQIQRLSNDYVKFMRFAQWRLDRTGQGILAFITDNGYLDGILFRDMRNTLRQKFSEIYILNLHGVAVRGASEKMKADKNVFDITQGVAISIFIKQPKVDGALKIHYAELSGSREGKYEYLSENDISSTDWKTFTTSGPNWYFVPTSSNATYESWPTFTDIIGTGNPKKDRDLRYGTGIKTRHDAFAIGWSKEDAISRIKQIADRKETDQELIRSFSLCTTAHFDVKKARIRATAEDLAKYAQDILFRPFDIRHIIYLREFICEPKTETMQHVLLGDNIILGVLRRDRRESISGFFVADKLVSKDYVSNLDDALMWPLYLYATPQEVKSQLYKEGERRANIKPDFIKEMAVALSLSYIEDGQGNLTTTFGPEDIFCYFYSILYSPQYRTQFADFLILDFPRIPVIKSGELFKELCQIGAQLIDLHLLRLPNRKGIAGSGGAINLKSPGKQGVSFNGDGDNKVEKVIYVEPNEDTAGRICINSKQYFEGVDLVLWGMTIGGYQPAEKWLKDRKGIILSFDDIQIYLRILVALAETKKLTQKLDDLGFYWEEIATK